MAAEFVGIKLAEAIVSQVVQRIADPLIHEATSLRAVKDDIESLKNELKYMRGFLKDADRKQGQDELVRIWIADVKDIAFEIADSIETYIYKVDSSYIKAFHLRKLRDQIGSIKAKLKGIDERRQRFQIEFSKEDGTETSNLRNLRRTYPDDEEHDVITLEESTANLKKKLIVEEDQRRIVSIVGMGGLGKTTLAKKVFNDVGVRNCFDCHAWVFISQQYVRREVLTEILLQVGFQSKRDEGEEAKKEKNMKESLEDRTTKREFLKRLEEDELVALMRSELENKRYLIVLDDIWDTKAWSSIERAFPNGRSGSKVLFTTRNDKLASSADSHSSTIRLPLLTPEESLELLKRRVFPKETFMESGFPLEFVEKYGNEMLKKCGGLPLAIVLLGGLLRKNNSLEGWKKVSNDVERSQSMINRLESDQEYRVEDILQLSFQDLPYHLKPCLLYMGSFPEDSEIHKSMLIRLWIAEGFVSQPEENEADEAIEDVAERFLEELIDRCMVQVDKKNRTGKGVKTCRLHDLLRDFCISKAKKENIFMIIGQNQMKTTHSSSAEYSMAHRSRRIVGHVDSSLDHFPWMEQVHPNCCSFLLFGIDTFTTITSRVKNFRLLKVLALDFVSGTIGKESNLKGIGSLILLRYLRLTSSAYQLTIPDSIGNLCNLQTLDIRGAGYKVRLTQSLARLTHLRHLLLPYYYSRRTCTIIRRPLFRMSSLRNIETLKGVRARDLIINGEAISLTSIRKLEITVFRSAEEVSLVLESLGHRLGFLQYLGMQLLFGDFPSLELLSQCHNLTALGLKGSLSIQNFSFLPKSLVKLKIWHCLFDHDKFTILEKLPNLRILEWVIDLDYGSWLADTRNNKYKWVCSADGFPKLEILTLEELLCLEEWEVEEGAMPNLKRLDIAFVENLRMIPEGLKHVTTLRELNINGMGKEFESRVRRVNEDGTEGADYYKVTHVPSITFSHTRLNIPKYIYYY